MSGLFGGGMPSPPPVPAAPTSATPPIAQPKNAAVQSQQATSSAAAANAIAGASPDAPLQKKRKGFSTAVSQLLGSSGS